MNTDTSTSPGWSTSCFGRGAPTLSDELATLGEHLDHCRSACGKWFVLTCHAEAFKRFVTSRVVTTIALLVLFIALCAAMF
jgi:hypothetical protein